jgi:hypothetical protein
MVALTVFKTEEPVLHAAAKMALKPGIAIHSLWIEAYQDFEKAKAKRRLDRQRHAATLDEVLAAIKTIQNEVAELKQKTGKA